MNLPAIWLLGVVRMRPGKCSQRCIVAMEAPGIPTVSFAWMIRAHRAWTRGLGRSCCLKSIRDASPFLGFFSPSCLAPPS
eukprot:symbB.v1.2.027793.t1/scaffold2806.1/size69854/5